MKINRAFVLALVLVSGIGCATRYIVLRDVPLEPSVTVLPANSTLNEVGFSNLVERYFIECGVRVLVAPAIKDVSVEVSRASGASTGEEDSPMTGGSTNQSQMGLSSEKRVEYFQQLDDLESTYAARSYKRNSQIKVILVETGEVVAVVNYYDLAGNACDLARLLTEPDAR